MRGKIRDVDEVPHPTTYVREWLLSVTNEHEESSRSRARTSSKGQPDQVLSRSSRSPSPRVRPTTSRQIAKRDAGITPADDGAPLDLASVGSPTASHKYARRRRHKTRPERYEYKAETSADIKRSTKAKSKKRHAHKADGATLNQDFKAPNVESERLTLKHGSMPGFLAKGKASEATDRRGLPDLTFSEMAFLGKKRQLDAARFRGIQTMTTRGKDRGGAREISGYFDDVDTDRHDANRTRGQADAKSGAGSHSVSDNLPSAAHFDEPGRSAGATHRSPSEPRPHASAHSKEVGYVPPEARIDSLQLSHPCPTSTSISWSTSPPRRIAKVHLGQLQDSPFVPRAARTIYPRSSISNPTAIRRNTGAHANTLQERHHATPIGGKWQYYSLEDLKQLANTAHALDTRTETRKEPEHAEEAAPRSENNASRMSGVQVVDMPGLDLEGGVRSSTHDFAQERALPLPLLAQADLALMPQAGSEPQGRCRFRHPTCAGSVPSATIGEAGSGPGPDFVPGLYRSGLDGPEWTALPSCDPYAGAYFGSDRGREEYPSDALDEFDTDLLRSVEPPTSHSRISNGVISTCHTSTQPTWPVADYFATTQAAPERRAVSNSFTPNMDPRSTDEGVHDRAQLLRPSQQAGGLCLPFASFKRPRLLY